MKNYNFSEDAIKEAAYYIWKNAGCPANTSLQDWNAAINQLSAAYANNGKKTTLKTSSLKTVALKKSSSKNTKTALKTTKAASKAKKSK